MPALLEVVMFGGARTGKTTLLTQMMAAVRRDLKDVGMRIELDQETQSHFNRARQQLSELVEAVWRGDDSLAFGIPSTVPNEGAQIRRYVMSINNSDGASAAILAFSDYPGELLADLGSDQAEPVREALGRAQALVVAINTPMLMAAKRSDDPEWAELNEYANHPNTLTQLLKDAPTLPETVLFCPIKTERWLHDGPTPEIAGKALRSAVEDTFSSAIRTLKRRSPQTEILLLPVETCGTIAFDDFRPAGVPGAPLTVYNTFENYRPVSGESATLGPRGNDLPLRHLMRRVTARVDYSQLGEAYAAEFNAGADWGDKLANGSRAVVNWWADWWVKTTGINIPDVAELFDDLGGRAEYLTAARALAKSAVVKPPASTL